MSKPGLLSEKPRWQLYKLDEKYPFRFHENIPEGMKDKICLCEEFKGFHFGPDIHYPTCGTCGGLLCYLIHRCSSCGVVFLKCFRHPKYCYSPGCETCWECTKKRDVCTVDFHTKESNWYNQSDPPLYTFTIDRNSRFTMGDSSFISVQGKDGIEVDENGQAYTKPDIEKSLTEKIWDMLDAAIEDVLTSPTEFNRARGRAFAETVHLVCQDHYATVDDVTREAVRRFKQKTGKVAFQVTPGYEYNPMPQDKFEALTLAKSAPISPLTDDQKEAVIKGLKAGFTVQQLSNAYGVTPSVIEAFVEKAIDAS